MTDESLRSQTETATAVDRVEELASALLDHAITDEQVRELGVMLERDRDARRRYIEHMQLHADLVEHYNDKQQPTPVLGMLGDAVQALGADAPVIAPPAGG